MFVPSCKCDSLFLKYHSKIKLNVLGISKLSQVSGVTKQSSSNPICIIFPYSNIHEFTWTPPHGKHSWTGHILIKRRCTWCPIFQWRGLKYRGISDDENLGIYWQQQRGNAESEYQETKWGQYRVIISYKSAALENLEDDMDINRA
jgi:hypothetical protein